MDVNINIPTDGEFQKMLIQAIAKEAAARIAVPEKPEPLLTRYALAKAFDVGGGTVDQWRAQPGFPYHLKGERTETYLYSEVRDWLKANAMHS